MSDDRIDSAILSEQFDELHKHRQVIYWWQSALNQVREVATGSAVLVAKVAHEAASYLSRIEELERRLKQAEKEREELAVKIGEMQADILILSERVDKAKAWATEISKKMK